MKSKKVYPSKRYINLAASDEHEINLLTIIPIILLIVVLLAAFAKFAIIDRFVKVQEAEAELIDYRMRLSVANAKLENYDQVLEEYQKYSINWMDDVERKLVKKTDMISLINEEILKSSECRTLSISGNTLSAQLVGLSLTDTSKLVDRLNARDDVEDVQVFSATTEETLEDQVIVSIVVTMKKVEEGDAE